MKAKAFSEKYIPVPESGCWLWLNAIDKDGYGRDGKGKAAHRVSYKLHHGECPKHLDIDHKCRVRSCVNPDHLQLVTRQETIRQGTEANKRPNCPQGHPYDEANTYTDKHNIRHCRACNRLRKRS